MLQITKTADYDLWIGKLNRPYIFLSPFGGQEFALLLVVADTTVMDHERDDMSREIVRQGCRYAVCFGNNCSKWHDAIDLAFIYTDPYFSPPEEKHIMTTSHEHESLADVTFFFRTCTTFENFTPRHYLVLIVGDDDKMVRTVTSSLRIDFDVCD